MRRGVTLVELIVAFALIVIVFAAVVPQFRTIRLGWAGAEAMSSLIQNGRVLSEHIIRNLSAANRVVSVSLASQTQGYITFADANDDNYRYIYSSGYVAYGLVGSEQQLAGPVSRFQITCYSIYPTVSATTDGNDIRYVEIETDFTNSDSMGTDRTFKTEVFLRTNTDDGCGIVGYWKLDETSGTTAADSSGSGNDGTLVNMDPGMDWVTGRINNALDFDGGNDYVTLPIDSVIGLLEDCTIAAWVNWSGSGSSWQRVWDFGTGTTYNMFLTVNCSYTGYPRFAITTSGWSNEEQLDADEELTANTWHHIAVTIDADDTTHKLYIDGELVDEDTSAYLTPSDLGNTDRNYLANSNYSADPELNGRIDDVRIYNRVLDAEEIIEIANSLNFRSFEEAKTPTDTTSVTISTPNDINENDLLIAAVATEGDTSSSLSAPGGEGWTVIDVDNYSSGSVTPSVTHDSGLQCLIGLVVNADSASVPVAIIGTWDTDSSAPITHSKETGSDRALLFFAHADTSQTLNSVTYGGQSMTIVIDQPGNWGFRYAYVAAFILDDAGITAAGTTTFNPTWSSYPGSNVTYSSVFLQGVDQSDLYDDTASTSSYGTDITTSALTVTQGDMAIKAAACHTGGSYTMNNGFTEAFELSTSGYDGAGGYRSAGSAVTLGTWWKLADPLESTSHQFTWTGARQAYGWIMRFTGHDTDDPINAFSVGNDSDAAPTSPSVTTDTDNCLIVRIGGFDGGDITIDDTGLPSDYTDITMDRSVAVLFEDGFEGTPWDDQWTTNWESDTNPVYAGSYSASADRNDDDLTSDNINTSSYSAFVVSFWYRHYHIEYDDDCYLQFYDGSGYDNIFNFENSTAGQWNYYKVTVTDAQYIRSNFRIRFHTSMNSSDENVWVDDVAVYIDGGVSGGAGYTVQETAGISGTEDFALGQQNDSRMVTVAITPGALCEVACCSETIKP